MRNFRWLDFIIQDVSFVLVKKKLKINVKVILTRLFGSAIAFDVSILLYALSHLTSYFATTLFLSKVTFDLVSPESD